MKKYITEYLQYLPNAEEADKIDFEMPSFCSGDYSATIYKDEYGLYINKENAFFDGCRDFKLIKKRFRAWRSG